MKKKKSNRPAEKEHSIAERIRPVGTGGGFISCLFYGRSGTCKTTLSASFPKPLLILDIKEDGDDSVGDVEDAKVLEVKEWSDIEEIYWYLKSKHGSHYATLVLDTVTKMQDLAIFEAKRQAGRDADGPMSQQLWGSAAGLVRHWLEAFRELDINLVILAQDRVTETDEDDDSDQI